LDDPGREPRRGRLPLGLLGALALIWLVERHVATHDFDYFGGGHWTFRVAGWNSASKAKDCRVLCFGDSLLKMGFVPRVVEARAGLRAYNLAIPGGQAPIAYFLLKKALAAGSRPSAVVVDYFPRLLADGFAQNRDNYPFLLDLRESLDLAWAYRDPGLFLDLALREGLPSARAREAIRPHIRWTLDGHPHLLQGEIRRALRNWDANRGAEIAPGRPGPPHDLETWYRRYFPEKVTCHPVNQLYIDRFMRLAESHAIQVYWLLPPYQPTLQALCERTGFDADHERFVRSMLGRYPRLRVIDGRRSSYEPDVFFDLHHLARDGASNFTTEVAGLIRDQPEASAASPRWSALPAYRRRPVTVPIEDDDTSRAVVARWMLEQRR